VRRLTETATPHVVERTIAQARLDATGHSPPNGILIDAESAGPFASCARGQRLCPLFPFLSTTSSDPQLRRPGNTDSEDYERADQSRSEKRNRHGDLTAYAEELDTHRAGVLDNEVDQGDAEDGGDRHGYPGPPDASVTNSVLIPVPTESVCGGYLFGLALEWLVVPVMRFDERHTEPLPKRTLVVTERVGATSRGLP
jgi:hypothetical protein